MKKRIIGMMAGLMALALSACGSKDPETVKSKEYVYRAEEVELSGIEDMNTLTDFYIRDGRMYISCYEWKEGGSTVTFINRKMDGSDEKKAVIAMEENSSYSYTSTDAEGNYYGIRNDYFENNDDPENYVWRNDYYLVKLDPFGKEIWKEQLNNGTEDNYWIQWMELLPDGRSVIQDNGGISIYDRDGKTVRKTKTDESDGSSTAYVLSDGTLVVSTYNSENNKNIFRKLDTDTGEFSEEYTMPENYAENYTMYPGVGYDFLLVGNEGVAACNLGDETAALLMNYVDSDLSTTYIYNLSAISEKEFYGLMNDQLTGNVVLMKFTKVEPEDVADKEILKLACYGMDFDVRRHVIDFNKTNPEYRVRIEDYAQFNTEEDYAVGLTRLNTDIASGNIPDILLLNQDIPAESYAAKGLFEDLYPYIEKDEEIHREDFFPNVLAAYETEGRLYRMVPRFSIYTVVGKTADVGKEPGWTLPELNTLMASKPEGTQVFQQTTKNSMLEYSISMSGQQFIDWETGECSFDSPGFTELLEFVNQFPDKIADSYYDDAYYRDYDTQWREGRVLLNMLNMDGFSSYNYMKKGIYGEDITLVGFPTPDKNGAAIIADLDMAMSSRSKHKEGAWQFLRYFLTDAYQKEIDYGWPLSMKQTDVLAEEAKKKPSYEDENGNLVEYEQTYTVGDVEITITQPTDAEIAEILTYIKSVDQVYTHNSALLNIISEEAASYFAGQKNAKDVADIIQSRVKIYVSESR